MLGRFLEYSLPTPDIQASLDFYLKLGFSQAPVGETWQHPYAVVTDGRIHLGLHQAELPASLTFVKHDLLKHLEALEKIGTEFQYRHLGNDVFNEAGWLDPGGQAVRLIEARTFSPIKRQATAVSKAGYFAEIGLPAADLEKTKAYWEQFGFVGMDERENRLPHVTCTSDFIDLGLYEPQELRRSTLIFEPDDLAVALRQMAEVGIAAAGKLPASLNARNAALLIAPEGTPLLLATASA